MFFLLRHVYFLGWTPLRDPPPQTPLPVPHPNKKGTNLLLFEAGIHLHTHQDLKLKCCRVMGQKLRYGRPCTRDHQAPITGLHSPTLLLFLQNSTDYLMLAQSCKYGVNCCFIGLTHPAACTRVRVPLTFGHVHRPTFTQFTQKGCQSTGIELRIPMIHLKLRRSDPVQFWRGGPKNSGPPWNPPIGPIYIPIDSSRRQDSKYINFN